MKITLLELQHQIRRGPGIVIGPGMSTSPSREADCLTHLKTVFQNFDNGVIAATYLDYADLILASGKVPHLKLRTEIESFFRNSAFINPQLQTIIKANWAAVISLCSDNFFKTKLSDFLHSTPTRWAPITIAEANVTIPLNTVPYYALMGDISDHRESCALAISTSGLLNRQRQWATLIAGMPNILKGDPLIFLGTGLIVERVCEFFNELLKLQPQIPKKLIFLENDPTPNNAVFKNLVSRFCTVEIANCSLTELANVLSYQSLAKSAELEYTDSTKHLIDPKAFSSIQDQVLYVPRRDEIHANVEEHNRLLDLLFQPTHLDWSPYSLNLELRRDICTNIEDDIKLLFASKATGPKTIELRGEAGIGKTTICRTVAFEMAQKGYLCLWVRRAYGELSGGRFDSVVEKLNDSIRRPGPEVVFFLDDPNGNRITLPEVTSALAKAHFRWVVVAGIRKTDVVSLGVPETLANNEVQLEVPADFTPSELERLPEYLVKLGIATSLDVAKNMMLPAGLKHSKDVLCSLWYLLPQTHSAIEDSLIGEYKRLGDAEGFVHQFADAVSDPRSVAKAAYEFVTATSGFENVPLPVEVLVSALGISYADWGQQCKERKPLWGLLYEEEYPSAETYAYRTRNQIVTDVLLRTLNQGTSNHTGEFRCLKKLLSACTSNLPQYKTFIFDLLVTRRSLIEKRFPYIQAMELYETAINAYPKSLGRVEHQRAIVKRRLHGDAQEAYDELKKLIVRTHDRAIADQDSPENLHTSAAAALNQLIKEDRVDPVAGAETVFEHISASLAIDQFSLHSYHVHAGTLLRIASSLRNTNQVAFMANLERAARITARGLLLVRQRAETGKTTRSTIESQQMFDELKREVVLAHPDFEKAKKESLELFNTSGDQTGLAFIGRILLFKATDENKGHAFKKVDDYLRDVFSLVTAANKQPVDELVICRIELIVNWQMSQNKGPIYWEQLEKDLQHIVRKARYASDVLWIFYLAVVQYNLGKFNDAEGNFQLLRSRNLPWDARHLIRCFYLGDKAVPKVFEGKITQGSHKRYIYSSELGNDVQIRKHEFVDRPDELKHFKIGFTFYGPIAVGRD